MKSKHRKRLGIPAAPRAARLISATTPTESPAILAPVEAGYIHPGRYPKHPDPTKGQVYGGECNTTRCENRNAVMWNACTRGLYCHICADGINFRPGELVCTDVEEKPDAARMDELYAACMERTRRIDALRPGRPA